MADGGCSASRGYPAEDLESGERNEIRGEIVFDHVSFAYEDDQNHVLRDLSFTIHAKQRVAIMGPTGSGKSSLVQLLVRMQDYEGSIKIDGVELRNIAKEWIRSQIRIVLQEPFLFSKTIEENIALAKRDASFEEIRHAARIASIHEDIEGFDQGYATAVGEKGVTLSGGQKQRIAIARTILDQPPRDSLSFYVLRKTASGSRLRSLIMIGKRARLRLYFRSSAKRRCVYRIFRLGSHCLLL